MDFVFNNLNWMSFNLTLAVIPLILTILVQKRVHPALKAILFTSWFLFLPNTIYLITDFQYLPRQILQAGVYEKLFLLMEYFFLSSFGVFSYLAALAPLKVVIKKLHIKKQNKSIFYVLFHFMVAFGVVLGKTQRTHSWYVATDSLRVLRDVKAVLFSPALELWVIFFGILISIIFYVSGKYALRLRVSNNSHK